MKDEEAGLDPSVEYKIVDVHTTQCNHFYVEEGTNLNMISAVCNKCWSGCQFDPKDLSIKNGKLIRI